MQVAWDADFFTLSRRFAGRPAVADAAGEMDYAGLFGRAWGLAAALVAAGAGPGVAVATCLGNDRRAVWGSLGVCLTGACEVPLNPALTPEERRYCLEVARIRHVVAPGDAAGFENVAPLDPAATLPLAPQAGLWPRAGAADPGRIVFTSGTTGRPKAAVASHGRRWVANLLQRASMPALPRADDRVLLMTPFSHGAALICYAFLQHGASCHLMDGVREAAVLDLLERRCVTQLFAPPTVLARIVAAAAGRRFPHVRTIWCGTSTLPPGVYRRAREIFGPVVRITYGMSEMINPIAVLEPEETDRFYADDAGAGACLGFPAAGVTVELRDEAGAPAAAGEAGEIHLNGWQRFDGYLGADGRLAALADETFHATGDVGRLDADGRLYLLGRMNDVVKSGGYKVFPQEVEAALSGVAEAGAVGLPSELWGEVLVAAVALPRPEDWEARCRAAAERLSPAKRPRLWVAVEALPRNFIGKVDRRRLRALIQERWELVDGRRPALQPRG